VSSGPSGVVLAPRTIESTTGTVPLQWNVTFRPENCGVRPVPRAPSPHGGLKPFSNAATS
jgi:hypothetical protein